MQQISQRRLYLADLTHGPTAETICVRVMRKWLYDNTQTAGYVRYVGLVLADEKGGSIYGHIPAKQIDTKAPLLELDKTYLISKFHVKNSRTMYVPFVKEFMIEFTGLTSVITVRDPPDGLPNYVYNITPYSDLNPTYPHSAVYVDVLGVITSAGATVEQHVGNQAKPVPMKEIIIKNLTDEELKVTLWGEHAENFSLPQALTSDPLQSIVVLFVGCVAKTMNRKTQVNGSYGCRWFFNPDIVEAQPFYENLSKKPVLIYHPPATHTILQGPPLSTLAEHATLAEINPKDPFHLAKAGYKCIVKLTGFPEDQRCWYMGCRNCKTAVKGDIDSFQCPSCRQSETKTFYKLSFNAEDETSEGKFFAYDAQARAIIKRDAVPVAKQQAREPGFPRFLTEAISRKFTFHVILTEDSYSDIHDKTWLVKSVLVDHEFEAIRAAHRAQIQAQDVASPGSTGGVSDVHAAQHAPNVLVPALTQQVLTTQSGAQTPPPNISGDDTPRSSAKIDSQHETTSALNTDPTPGKEVTEINRNQEVPTHGDGSSARRALFQHPANTEKEHPQATTTGTAQTSPTISARTSVGGSPAKNQPAQGPASGLHIDKSKVAAGADDESASAQLDHDRTPPPSSSEHQAKKMKVGRSTPQTKNTKHASGSPKDAK